MTYQVQRASSAAFTTNLVTVQGTPTGICSNVNCTDLTITEAASGRRCAKLHSEYKIEICQYDNASNHILVEILCDLQGEITVLETPQTDSFAGNMQSTNPEKYVVQYRLLAASDFYRVSVLVGGAVVASSIPATPIDTRIPGRW